MKRVSPSGPELSGIMTPVHDAFGGNVAGEIADRKIPEVRMHVLTLG